MRSLVVVACLCGTAAADPLVDDLVKLTLGAGEETIDKASQGTISADAAVIAHQLDKSADSTGTVGVASELRTGDKTDVAASGGGNWTVDYDVGGGQRMPVLGLWLDGDLGHRPGLDARRDVEREAYATTNVGFRLAMLFGAEGDRRATALRFGFGGNKLWQGGQRRAEITAEFELAYYCRLHADAEPWCLHLVEVDGTGVSGKQEATVSRRARGGGRRRPIKAAPRPPAVARSRSRRASMRSIYAPPAASRVRSIRRSTTQHSARPRSACARHFS